MATRSWLTTVMSVTRRISVIVIGPALSVGVGIRPAWTPLDDEERHEGYGGPAPARARHETARGPTQPG
jgi:hypothetical protein